MNRKDPIFGLCDLIRDEGGTPLGEYFADLFIDDCLIAELKAPRTLASEPTAQLLGYLRASRIRNGLLINSGAPKSFIKKFIPEPIP